MISRIKNLFFRAKAKAQPTDEEKREVRFVREGENSWRVVYAE